MRKIYAKVLKNNNGYELIYEDEEENISAYTIFIQQEPDIPYRVLNEDNSTNYQASGDLHAKNYLNEMNYADIERKNNVDLNDESNIKSGIIKIYELSHMIKI